MLSIYNKFLSAVFLIMGTVILGLSIRIIRALTPLEAMPEYKHIFYSVLFFPGIGVLLTIVYPKFKFSVLKQKHIILSVSLGLLLIVSFVMGYLSHSS